MIRLGSRNGGCRAYERRCYVKVRPLEVGGGDEHVDMSKCPSQVIVARQRTSKVVLDLSLGPNLIIPT